MTVDSQTLRRRFECDGFVALPGFLAGDDLTDLFAALARFVVDVVPTMPRDHVFYERKEDPTTLKQIQQLGQHDDYFRQLFEAGPFRTVAETLLGEPVVPRNLQYFNKRPMVGQPTPPHQDGYYFMLDPCAAVTMWFALDEVDEENGCVRYVPGSHRLGMRTHARTSTLGFSQGIVDYPSPADAANEIACPARPGDLLVHHALTIHRADGNRSPVRSRRALGFIYYGESAREDLARKQAYQERLATELAEAGKI